jgi:hypothetical protein
MAGSEWHYARLNVSTKLQLGVAVQNLCTSLLVFVSSYIGSDVSCHEYVRNPPPDWPRSCSSHQSSSAIANFVAL